MPAQTDDVLLSVRIIETSLMASLAALPGFATTTYEMKLTIQSCSHLCATLFQPLDRTALSTSTLSTWSMNMQPSLRSRTCRCHHPTSRAMNRGGDARSVRGGLRAWVLTTPSPEAKQEATLSDVKVVFAFSATATLGFKEDTLKVSCRQSQ